MSNGIVLDQQHSNCKSVLWEMSRYFKDVILQQQWNKLMTSINEGRQSYGSDRFPCIAVMTMQLESYQPLDCPCAKMIKFACLRGALTAREKTKSVGDWFFNVSMHVI